jgi:hypothetical protein
MGDAIVQRAVMRWVSRCLTVGLLGLVVGLGTAGVARAAGLPSSSFGAFVAVGSVDGQLTPTDLSAGSAAGMGVVRIGAFDSVNANSDAIVTLLAQAHVALYPILGVPCPSGESSCSDEASSTPAVAASQIAQIVTAFAQRYGPNGTFWAANPTLPKEPIESYEIGNEPNLPLYWVVDGTHLHWADPADSNAVDGADYAEAYEAARSALHVVDPSARAIVGGLADSASDGVDVAEDEQFLSAFAPGSIDAVGFHPWVFDVSNSLLEPNTSQLRVWMNANGFSSAKLDINEIGACQSNPQAIDASRCPATESQTSAQWGAVATSYMKWALCTPSLGVENVQAFYWGDEPQAASEVYLPLFDAGGAETAYGADYLSLVKQLTTEGCSGSTTTGGTTPRSGSTGTSPGAGGKPVTVKKAKLRSMGIRVLRVTRHGRAITVTVRHVAHSGTLSVIAATRGRRAHRHRLRGRRGSATTMSFTIRLAAGRWTLTISGVPPKGYAVPKPLRRKVVISG